MSKILIIAEKNSLAKNCVKACELLGDHLVAKKGYYEGSRYVVSYAAGHFFSLQNLEDYLDIEPGPSGKVLWRDTERYLPYVPEYFVFKLKPACKEQYGILKELMNRPDVESIVNLGDADREGEIIVRLIIENGLKKPKMIYRIWGDDQTEGELKKCIENLREDAEFDSLAREGYARTYMDWLFGINVTRMLTLHMNGRGQLRAGRVLVPIVKEIYDRDMAIKSFKPETYYQAESHTKIADIPLDLIVKNDGENRKSKEEVELIADQLNETQLTVRSVEKKQKEIKAPKLFSLSKLQSFMGSNHKWGPDETLNVLQDLYLDGLVTYPRTNTEYMSEGEIDKASEIVMAHIERSNGGLFSKVGKSIFDNSKVESHSAITPTVKIPDSFKSDKHELLYSVVCNRFYAVFCNEALLVDETVMVIAGAGMEFKVKGEVLVQKGWSVFEERKSNDKELPKLSEGDVVAVNFMAIAKQTTPPKKHTVDSLLSYLNNPFRKEKQTEEDEYRDKFAGVEIGTEATRASIIKNALDCGYLLHKNGAYSITPLGEYLIDGLNKCHINLYKDKSVEFSQMLVRVRKDEMDVDECIRRCKEELEEIKRNMTDVELPASPVYGGSKKEAICACPYCRDAGRADGQIFEGQKNFYCSNATKTKGQICDFSLSKTAHERLTGKKVTPSQVKMVCEKGTISVQGIKKNKIVLCLSQNGIYTNLSFADKK